MCLTILYLSPYSLYLLFFCFTPLFCVAIKRDFISLISFPFLCHVQVILCSISLGYWLHWFTKKLRQAQKYPFLPNLRVLNSNLKSVFTHHMGCWMSFKIHFLHSHLNFFLPNLGAVSDEHGERFHQDIMKMESNYQSKWNPSMMGDFCWMLLRDIPEAKYTRSSKKTHFWLSVVLWIV